MSLGGRGVARRKRIRKIRGAHKTCTCCGLRPVREGNYFLCRECWIGASGRVEVAAVGIKNTGYKGG